MRYSKWIRCAVAAGLLVGYTTACDFVSPTDSNPNTVPDASVDQLFVGSQVSVWFFYTGELSRMTSLWLQSMAGTDRQYTAYDQYDQILEDLADTEFTRIYYQGGLGNLRLAQQKAEDDGRRVYAGILKIHEAMDFGMAAGIWGDIPYREANNPEITEPALDDQAQVQADVQLLLDEAIADIESGEGAGPGINDMVFGGDEASWIAVANTLKARFYLHRVEVDGNSAYTDALTYAANGITDYTGNWSSIHNASAEEANLWSQFQIDRSGYAVANSFMVELLDRDQNMAFDPAIDDDRLPVYFSTGTGSQAGNYIGSPTGEPAGDPGLEASNLNVLREQDYDVPMVSCWENYFIIAEANAALGNDGLAQAAFASALACHEDYWDSLGYPIDLSDVNTALTGQALFDAIMEQKYIANIHNQESWNDYKRTCIPAVTPYGTYTEIPARLYYADDERQTNSNIPAADVQGPIPGTRNDNDPNAC